MTYDDGMTVTVVERSIDLGDADDVTTDVDELVQYDVLFALPDTNLNPSNHGKVINDLNSGCWQNQGCCRQGKAARCNTQERKQGKQCMPHAARLLDKAANKLKKMANYQHMPKNGGRQTNEMNDKRQTAAGIYYRPPRRRYTVRRRECEVEVVKQPRLPALTSLRSMF